jgi:hypothetical protein
MSASVESPGRRTAGVVIALGTAQTLAWGSTYYLPAVLAAPMAREFGVSPAWIFGAFGSGKNPGQAACLSRADRPG